MKLQPFVRWDDEGLQMSASWPPDHPGLVSLLDLRQIVLVMMELSRPVPSMTDTSNWTIRLPKFIAYISFKYFLSVHIDQPCGESDCFRLLNNHNFRFFLGSFEAPWAMAVAPRCRDWSWPGCDRPNTPTHGGAQDWIGIGILPPKLIPPFYWSNLYFYRGN